MSSTLQHFSHPEHPLVLKNDDVLGVDAKCYVCDITVIGSPTYTCCINDDIDCRSFYLHKSCAELPAEIHHHHTHNEHPLFLKPCPYYTCDVCSCDRNFTYTCTTCAFDLCVRCANLPQQIDFNKHNQHPLDLLPVDGRGVCDLCSRYVNYAYGCIHCGYGVCVFCPFEQRALNHEGHPAHTLQLMHRKALFNCDACFEEAEDSSYVCKTCEFWIHKRCAFAALTIPAPTYHHHSLNLIYSIPEMHRYFYRYCAICNQLVRKNCWLYYCHKCTFFVHMKCSTSSDSVSTVTDFEAHGDDNECDLVEFPLPSEESLLDLIQTQCLKYQVDKTVGTSSASPNDPQIIEEHRSHKNHPLERLQFSTSKNDNSNKNNDEGVLICDGCIQPITVSHPSYYACIQCGFFLHSFCATEMPLELPVGGSSFHPQHSLLIQKSDRFYNHVQCGVCWFDTNGFYYHCETCNINIDIRCAFLPVRIKHDSHKHFLVQRPCQSLVHQIPDHSHPYCSLTRFCISGGVGYACETCTNFQIHILCVIYPSNIKHRYDLHPISSRNPPFFYEGVLYCEICEEQVNNQWWLYHCGKSDQSFHVRCLQRAESVKLGGTIKLTLNNQPHTLVYVLKRSERPESPMYMCYNCRTSHEFDFFLECEGCGLLLCRKCVRKLQ